MNTLPFDRYEYKVGGSLPPKALCYVTRQADQDLLAALEAGEFCYVFNSRQMGKSSLKARSMQQLEAKGIACASVDVTKLGAKQVTADQWYKGLVVELVRAFKLSSTFDLKAWRSDHHELSAVQQLGLFIEDVLLVKVSNSRICIFLEEIDNVKRLAFSTDDLFTLIRACYEQRSHNSIYNRLTFCLLGVATPSDLIVDKQRTPFNIGRSIDLTGFKLAEAEPALAQGLLGRADPVKILQMILDWTGGQPFLTQKLCKLASENSSVSIDQLVQQQIVENWEAQDTPPHLRTIRDRIRGSETRRGQLLDLYQQVLQGQLIRIDDSPEQMELQLTGLVVKQQGQLSVYNPIYAAVFNQAWIEQELTLIRPNFYAVALTGWLASESQDESWLLRGRTLQEAQQWATNQRLSDQDDRFLAASRELEQRDLQQQIDVETKAKQTLEQANDKAYRRIRIGGVILAISVISAIAAGFWSRKMLQEAAQLEEVRSLSLTSTALLNSRQDLDALLIALKAVTQLKLLSSADSNTQGFVKLTLANALFQIREYSREANRLEGHTDQVRSVDFSPDGKLLVTASEDSTVRLWTAEGQALHRLSGQNQPFRMVRFSPDGQKIAAIDTSNTIKLWNIDGTELFSFPEQSNLVNSTASLCFIPNHHQLAASGVDQTIKLWDLDKRTSKTLIRHQHPINRLSCSPDGRSLVAVDQSGTVTLWAIDGQKLKSFQASQQPIFGVSFSPDGQMIATAGVDSQVHLWNRNGKHLRTIGKHSTAVLEVRFSPDGQSIASVSADKTARLWSLTGELRKTFRGHRNTVFGLSFHPNDQSFATASGDDTVRVWRLRNENHRTLTGHTDSVWAVSTSPDGSQFATAGDDQTIRLWSRDGQTLNTIKTNREPNHRISSLSFSPDGQTLASSSSDKTINLWTLKGQLLKTLTGHTQEVHEVSFSPNGQWLASASFDGTIRLWQEGQLVRTIESHAGRVWSVAFSPDGTQLAAANNNGTLQCWDLSGHLLKTIPAHQNYITRVRFTPDGTRLASASRDRTIKLWALNGQLLRTFEGHNLGVTGISFSPNGQVLASTSEDGTVRQWNVGSGQEILMMKTLGLPYWNVSFNPDGKHFVSVSDNGTVQIWNAETIDSEKQMFDRGCQWLKNYLRHNVNVDPSDRQMCDLAQNDERRR